MLILRPGRRTVSHCSCVDQTIGERQAKAGRLPRQGGVEIDHAPYLHSLHNLDRVSFASLTQHLFVDFIYADDGYNKVGRILDGHRVKAGTRAVCEVFEPPG